MALTSQEKLYIIRAYHAEYVERVRELRIAAIQDFDESNLKNHIRRCLNKKGVDPGETAVRNYVKAVAQAFKSGRLDVKHSLEAGV